MFDLVQLYKILMFICIKKSKISDIKNIYNFGYPEKTRQTFIMLHITELIL